VPVKPDRPAPQKPAAQPEPPTEPQQFPAEAIQGIYLAYHTLGNRQARLQLMDFIRQSCLNAVIIDVKNDHGYLSYHSQVPLAAILGANRHLVSDMGQIVAWFKGQGIYTVARIVTFKDTLLATAQRDLAAKHAGNGQIWRDHQDNAWVDPFQWPVWDYILQLAAEVASFGFDEIQFDVLRFPPAGSHGNPHFSQPLSAESRVSAISGFLSAARGLLSPFKTKIGANVLGYACWRDDDALAGHKLERLIHYLDVLAPILYPSAFVHGIPGHPHPLEAIQAVLYQSTCRAVERVKAIEPACQVRPWIQDFPDDAFDKRPFGQAELQAQISGVVQGQAAGFMAWNPQTLYTQAAYQPTQQP